MKKEKSYKAVLIKNTIIDAVKHLAFPVILCAIILIGVYVVLNYKAPVEEEEPMRIELYEGTKDPITIENDKLALTMDPTTTQIELLVKETGKVWKSNPEGVLDDTGILLAERQKLASTLLMSFSIQAGLETEYNSYNYSIANQLYEIEYDSNHIQVNYSLGDIEKEYYIPPVALLDDFNSWLEKFSLDDKNLIQQYYKKYDINKLSKKDKEIKDELLANYPIMETEVIYVLRDTTTGNVKKKIEQVFEDAGYTMEDYEAHKALSNAEKTSDKPIFKVSVNYRLDGGDMIVEVPMSALDYKNEFPMYTVTPLPYFGAGGSADEGYMLVPTGGGGLIHFNNGKTAQTSYAANVYGWDYALSRESVVHDTIAAYGVFGVSDEDDSFICILEEGAPYATVQADVAGKTHSYNYVNSKYSICVREKYDVGDIANSDIYVYLENLPDETLTQRYSFINSGSYVDMAKDYQKYLLDKYGAELKANSDSSTPVAVEVVGAVDKVKQILGVPVSRPLALTTFSEAEEMINTLKADGISNLSVKLSGWCNGGINQKILKSVKPISSLGGSSGLKDLTATASSLGVDLYLDGVTEYAYNSNIFNGFFSYTDAAKRISKDRAEQYKYSAITYSARENFKSYYLLHTDVGHKMIDNLVSATDKYNATGVSFREVGMDLPADYYRKDTSTRQEVMNEQAAKLKTIADAGKNIMINQGNVYALPYAKMVTNMDLRGSEYTIVDECVPFYQLAIHSRVNYTGNPINICGNEEDEILYSAEYGAGLMFTLMNETAFALQKTLYTEYYGSDFNAWHDRMLAIYNRYNSELGHTFNQEMVDHDNITDELSCTTYADGTKVYVNYSYENVTCEDGVIPARDYKVIR